MDKVYKMKCLECGDKSDVEFSDVEDAFRFGCGKCCGGLMEFETDFEKTRFELHQEEFDQSI